ncbi:MAG: efflux RND transporter permease subunit [Leptotrichiaceae bacterium]|nr:efflux RND transporter permease subunit [Leptotrichiaceae bacterium]
MTVAEFATKRIVATTMIIVFMIFSGYSALRNMKQELLPDFNFPFVVIQTRWTGATSEDVDTQITKKVEEASLNVDGIKNITTSSAFGTSVVVVQFNFGTDTDTKKVQIQSEIDKIRNNLPNDADNPVISGAGDKAGMSSSMALFIVLKGADEAVLTSFVDETMKPALQRNKGIGGISVFGGTEREIKVELDPYKLKAFNFSPSEIYSKIKQANTITPAGIITDGGKEFILRVSGEIKTLEQIENIILSNDNGQTLKLRDIARVSYGTKEKETYTRVNGKDAVGVIIEKSKDGNIVEIADTAKKQLEEMKPLFPRGASYDLIKDYSIDVKDAIKNVTSSGLQALIIAAIVLLVFLKDIRASIFISLSIPISAMFTFFLLSTQGVSLNLVSLMGLALAVGSLVDNSVVTLDNIFDHIQEYREPPLIAAVRGTNEVIMPMIASTMTSVCVFLPVIIFDGFVKEVFSGIAFSIIFALGASIIVAMLFIPMVSSRFLNLEKILASKEKAKYFNSFREKYEKIIAISLENKWKVVIGTVVLLIFTMTVIAPRVKTSFFPTIDNSEYSVVASLATGLDLEKSYEITKKIEETVKNDEVTESFYSISRKDAAIVNVRVKKGTFKAMDRIREKLRDMPDVNLTLSSEETTSANANKDYSFQIEGNNADELNRIANFMIREIKKERWMKDVKSSTEGGNPQARLEVNREKAESYGINVTDLTTMLNMSVLGIAPIEITEGTENLDVTLQIEEKYRNSLEKILDLEVKAEDGVFVRIGDIAKLIQVEGASAISKYNGIKIVTVGLNLDSSKGFNDAAKFVNESFKKSNPATGYKLASAGNAKNQEEMGGEMANALGLSVVLIYIVLAVQLESFILPLLIMSSLPLSVIGVIVGMVVTGVQLSMFVMIGIIMLMGMVVNNAIVLLDFVSGMRQKGMTVKEALVKAGGSRLRPILMTTLTTVLGWIPMALAIGGGSAGYYQGMAVAVMFGLSFSTLLTLIFIPVLYLIVEEKKEKRIEKRKLKKA